MRSTSSANTCPKTGNPLPNLPIPDPLLSLTPGTWAYDTMSRRVNEDILQRTYEENEDAFNSPSFATALERFNKLRSELDDAANTKLRHVQFESTDGRSADVVAREEAEWKSIMQPYIDNGDTWLSGKFASLQSPPPHRSLQLPSFLQLLLLTASITHLTTP